MDILLEKGWVWAFLTFPFDFVNLSIFWGWMMGLTFGLPLFILILGYVSLFRDRLIPQISIVKVFKFLFFAIKTTFKPPKTTRGTSRTPLIF